MLSEILQTRAQAASRQGAPTIPPRGPPSPIYFFYSSSPHYGFTNFSPHSVKYQGKRYPTSEHLFQALKVCRHSALKHMFLMFWRIPVPGESPTHRRTHQDLFR